MDTKITVLPVNPDLEKAKSDRMIFTPPARRFALPGMQKDIPGILLSTFSLPFKE